MPNLDETLTELLNRLNSISEEDKIKYMSEFDDKSIDEKEELISFLKNKVLEEENARKLEFENIQNKRGM